MNEKGEYIIPGFLEPMEYGFEYLLVTCASILVHRVPLGEELLGLVLSLLTLEDRARFHDDLAEQGLIDGEARDDYMKQIGNVDDLVKTLSAALFKQPWSASKEASIRGALSEAVSPLDAGLAGAKDRYNTFSRKLMDIFYLSGPEAGLISFCMCSEYNNHLEKLFDAQTKLNKVSFLSLVLKLPREHIKGMLSKDSDLVRKGLIDYPRVLRSFGHFGDWIMLNSVMDRALSYGDLDSITDHFFLRQTKPVYPLQSFPVEPSNVEIMRNIVRTSEGCNILLYGPPGTGKTEFARSFCKDMYKDACELVYGVEGENSERLSILLLAASILKDGNSILIVDDADTLLSGSARPWSSLESVEKSLLNNFMESVEVPVIWIANNTRMMDDAVARRFACTLKFEPSSTEQRLELLKVSNAVGLGHPLSEADLRSIAFRYNVPVSKIADALRYAPVCTSSGKPLEVRETVEELLSQYVELVTGEPQRRGGFDRATYDPGIIRTDTAAEDILSIVNRSRSKPGGGLSILFHGEPGTGKTALAEYLAEAGMLRLVKKDASQLLSHWVGMTEKNIAESFREAEREKALLLIDEVDTFLRSRGQASRSFEISMTNQFLTMLEDFRGIVVCSTNMVECLDPAVLRRFHLKVRFDYPDGRGLEKLIHLYFPDLVQEDKLSEFLREPHRLTPGDVAAVNRRLEYESGKVRGQKLLELLRKEESYKTGEKRIGF